MTAPLCPARANRLIRCPEPPPEASVCPSPAASISRRAEGGSRAAPPPSPAREPLRRPSTRAASIRRWAAGRSAQLSDPLDQKSLTLFGEEPTNGRAEIAV